MDVHTVYCNLIDYVGTMLVLLVGADKSDDLRVGRSLLVGDPTVDLHAYEEHVRYQVCLLYAACMYIFIPAPH